MEYDCEVVQLSSLFGVLETCLSKCRHALQDEELVEHYENLYQSNLFQYNKILNTLQRSVEETQTKAESINAAIVNDEGIKNGMHLELDTLLSKCESSEHRILELAEDRKGAQDLSDELSNQDEKLAQSLEQTASDLKSTESQTVLAYYALLKVKEDSSNIEDRISAAERDTMKMKATLCSRQNTYRMMLADLDDHLHIHKLELNRIACIHGELDGQRAAAEAEHKSLLIKACETKSLIADLIDAKSRDEAELASLDGEINDLATNITALRKDVAHLENEIAERATQLEEATASKERMSATKAELSGRVSEVEADVQALQSNNEELQSAISDHNPRIQELEHTLHAQMEDMQLRKSELADHLSACNILRMKAAEIVINFSITSKELLDRAEGLFPPGWHNYGKSVGYGGLKQLVGNSMCCQHICNQMKSLLRKRSHLESQRHEVANGTKEVNQELQRKMRDNEQLTKDLDDAQKLCAKMNEDIARLKEEVDQVTCKEDGREQMRLDLRKEHEYIKKTIEELKVQEEQNKVEYNRQIEDQIEAQKARLKQLKSDDCPELLEIIEEERRNSAILLTAALEALDLEHTKEQSKLEAKHSAMVGIGTYCPNSVCKAQEEKEKFDAIRKVNASEIARLRATIEEKKVKPKAHVDHSVTPPTPKTPISRQTMLPPDATKIPQPKDASVHFKVSNNQATPELQQTPTLISTPGSAKDSRVPLLDIVKKEPRRKCIRRVPAANGNGDEPKAELDLFC
ncbi:Cell wall surface anchor family protein, putative [Babesia ovata]|uniref:Cell wall surface anchor family protein, putative n=1 Tax=Babesia ovata TaxID=189622 RepID=A0A2H6K6H9_9APIC|nr:Cell wall surface anchor family protein, putative [Babesia ovata]GBE58590.1 Cell wall surface anchor family protein, putative [Babesia ovata]